MNLIMKLVKFRRVTRKLEPLKNPSWLEPARALAELDESMQRLIRLLNNGKGDEQNENINCTRNVANG